MTVRTASRFLAVLVPLSVAAVAHSGTASRPYLPGVPAARAPLHQPAAVLSRALERSPAALDGLRSRLHATGADVDRRRSTAVPPAGRVRSRVVAGTANEPTEVVDENWSAGDGAWVPWRKTTYTYTAFGAPLEVITWYFLASLWVQHYRDRYVYDEDGYLIEAYDDDWDGEAWVAAAMIAYANNALGRPLTAVERDWTGTEWADLYRWTFTYDDAGDLVEERRENRVGDAWVNYMRFLYVYTVTHQLLTFEYQMWLAAAWTGMLRSTLTYDVSGWLILILVQTWSGTQWDDDYRYTYTNDASGRPVEEVVALWGGSSWTPDLRRTSTYDAGGNLTQVLEERWDGLAWLYLWLYQYAYAVSGTGPAPGGAGIPGAVMADLLESVTSVWADTAWKYSNRTSYSYEPGTGVELPGGLPAGFRLDPAYPNPFNPSTTIGFTLPERAFVRIVVHDVTGARAAVLAEGERGPGSHLVEWDAAGFSSGVYYCRMLADGFEAVRKLLLVR